MGTIIGVIIGLFFGMILVCICHLIINSEDLEVYYGFDQTIYEKSNTNNRADARARRNGY